MSDMHTPRKVPRPTALPCPPAPRSAAAVAADSGTTRRPRWVARWLRRERADAIAAYQREIAARALTARRSAACAGVHVGRPPFGYLVGPQGRLEPDPATADAVRLLFRWRVVDGVAPAQIAALLREYPRTFPRPRTGPDSAPVVWSARVVAVILANPRYTGRQVIHAARRDGIQVTPAVLTERVHPALVDDRLWCLAQPPGHPLPAALTPDAGVVGPTVPEPGEAR